ncbi:emp24/gp25L/p24 family/GOLD-domain-containing protein [Elsinoe ampelina]|uniref:Emp24/gp25L/p24 family/GOLD-domain-containing protein n=1 Tax=Elsinoe ampelina TaxID=302913 RepID=A0A6A6G4D0_9PEZI|nr:emp24/gp25L/p24 family/GOLD-domain-containing protein [Elsinoe ampelina]
MLFLIQILALASSLFSIATATALTYNLPPYARECFFTQVNNKGAKVAFYFAVQSGGSFDVDYSVHGPVENNPHGDRVIFNGEKERQGDYVFTANVAGEYRFCFDNTISSFAEKLIDFEISVENEPRAATIPTKQGAAPEQASVLEESVMKISSLLSSVSRSQKYFRTRENRNFSTVRSTEKRIWNFSLMESGLMVGMAGLQVFVVRMFFTGGRKGYV